LPLGIYLPAPLDLFSWGAGFSLQLLGLVIVAKGLNDLRRVFERPWIKPRPPYRPQTHYLKSKNSVEQGQSSTGRIEVVTGDPTATNEMRISQLEANLRLAREAIYEIEMNLGTAIQTVTNTLDDEKAKRFEGIRNVDRRLEEAVGDAIKQAIVGLLATCGLLLSSL